MQCNSIHKLGYDIHELEYKWNHMTMFSEDWNNNANKREDLKRIKCDKILGENKMYKGFNMSLK